MNKPARISCWIVAGLFVLAGALHLGPLMLTTLFGYFALRLFNFFDRKYLAVMIYVVVVIIIGFGLFYFSRQAYKTLPEIAKDTIPAVVDFAEHQGIELPFTDYTSLKSAALNEVKDSFANIGRYARAAAFGFAQLLIGLVVAASIFLHPRWGTEAESPGTRDSVYGMVVGELNLRFRAFYRSFATMMGAQIVISLINTALTAIFLAWNGYPYIGVIIVLTFLFGLLPIIGNLLSNTLIVGVGFTISPRMALIALIFLIIVHKLEYFLNSKIIGDRIKNPMWLTLIGLVIGEKLMGIPGMILAPVMLHYLKTEASHVKMTPPPSTTATVPISPTV